MKDSFTIEDNPIVAGIGAYRHYQLYLRTPDRVKQSIREKLDTLGDLPTEPKDLFPDGATAEKWVRAVIDWCSRGFPDYCGGSPRIVTLERQ